MKKLVLWIVLSTILLTGFAAAEDTPSHGYGYIDRDGNVVIAPQFDFAFSFVGTRGRFFTGQLTSYRFPNKGKYGFIDENGQVVIPAIYDYADDFSESGAAVVCKNGKYGVIDTTGNIIIDCIYDHISYQETAKKFRAYNGPLLMVDIPQSGTYYVFDETGNEIYRGEFDSLYCCDGYYEAEKNNKWALISEDGTQLTDYIYDHFYEESDNMLIFSKDRHSGYMDKKGNIIIDAIFDSAGSFTNGNAIVRKDGKYCLIDEQGTVLVTYKADSVGYTIVNGCTYAYERQYGSPNRGYYYLMRIDGTYITDYYCEAYSIDSLGRWKCKNGYGCWGVIDTDANIIFPFTSCDSLYSLGEDRYVIERRGKYALADQYGNLVTGFIWDAMSLAPSDLIAVYSSGADF